MKVFRLLLPFALFFFIGVIGQAQVAESTPVKSKDKETTCQKVCTPAMASTLVKLGLCTPQEVAKCQNVQTDVKTASTTNTAPSATKVASVSKERSKVAGCASQETKATTTCAKTCKGIKKQ